MRCLRETEFYHADVSVLSIVGAVRGDELMATRMKSISDFCGVPLEDIMRYWKVETFVAAAEPVGITERGARGVWDYFHRDTAPGLPRHAEAAPAAAGSLTVPAP